jgi:hypothetical protein
MMIGSVDARAAPRCNSNLGNDLGAVKLAISATMTPAVVFVADGPAKLACGDSRLSAPRLHLLALSRGRVTDLAPIAG